MSYEHFGILLRELRESRNLTREQLAQNICTPKQIYRIEKGVYEPSLYLLNQLSIKLNMDLNEYFKMCFSSQSIIGYEGIKSINNALDNNNIILLKELIQKYENLQEFKEGENLQHIYYGKAIYTALLENKFDTSIDYCIKGIILENSEFTIDTITHSTYSNVGLSLINCISMNYMAMMKTDAGIKILIDLLYVLDHFIINSPYPMYQATHFSKKIYQSTLSNLSLQLMKKGEVNLAFDYVNKGIEFSLKENSLRYLPDLHFMKFSLLYLQENYEEAKEYYNRLIYLYKITNQEDKINELHDSLKDEYPKINI